MCKNIKVCENYCWSSFWNSDKVWTNIVNVIIVFFQEAPTTIEFKSESMLVTKGSTSIVAKEVTIFGITIKANLVKDAFKGKEKYKTWILRYLFYCIYA